MKQLDATERALTDLFARQTENLAVGSRAFLDDTASVSFPRSAQRRPALIGLAVGVVVVVAAVAIGVWRRPADRIDPARRSDPVARVGAPLHARTDRADLSVDDYLVTGAGRRFTGNGVAPSAHSDPGGPTYWSLELGWHDAGLAGALTLYFASDGRDWWVDEIRARALGIDEVTFTGNYFRSPLGAPFAGDLDLTDQATSVTLHLGGIRLTTSPQRFDCNGLARPYAVRDAFNDQTIPLFVGTSLGEELQLLDTRDCALASQNDRATFTYVSQDPSIAQFLRGDCTHLIRAKCERGALANMRGLRPGQTVVAVTARDGESGALITTSNLTVVVGSGLTRSG